MAFDQCRFAECLGKYEAIWNVRAKDHGNKEKRKAQLQALADECGISVDLAETKYTSLRTYFVKQRRKVKESHRNGCGLGEIYRPSWPPYNALTFLEKTLDLQNSSDMTPDSSMRLSMVDNIRIPLHENIRPITMVDLAGSTMPDHIDLSKNSRSPEVNTIILSMPENSRSPTPSAVVSPLPEATMRIPMPESMRLPIKIEGKDPEQGSRFPALTDSRNEDNSPQTGTNLRSGNTPPQPSIFPSSTSVSPRSVNSTFSPHLDFSSTSVSTHCPANAVPISSASIVLSSYPLTFPHSLPPSHSTPLIPPAKLRKRNAPKADESQLGTILQDAVENLRTISGSYREDTNDDVSGFLKMTGYQLRSIQDPIRRMRVMHSIQGLILNELSSCSKPSDKTTVQKFSDDIDSLELSV